MRRQKLLLVVEEDITTHISEVSAIQCDASINSDGELIIKITYPPDELGRYPITAYHFNHYETKKIRAVLERTK